MKTFDIVGPGSFAAGSVLGKELYPNSWTPLNRRDINQSSPFNSSLNEILFCDPVGLALQSCIFKPHNSPLPTSLDTESHGERLGPVSTSKYDFSRDVVENGSLLGFIGYLNVVANLRTFDVHGQKPCLHYSADGWVSYGGRNTYSETTIDIFGNSFDAITLENVPKRDTLGNPGVGQGINSYATDIPAVLDYMSTLSDPHKLAWPPVFDTHGGKLYAGRVVSIDYTYEETTGELQVQYQVRKNSNQAGLDYVVGVELVFTRVQYIDYNDDEWALYDCSVSTVCTKSYQSNSQEVHVGQHRSYKTRLYPEIMAEGSSTEKDFYVYRDEVVHRLLDVSNSINAVQHLWRGSVIASVTDAFNEYHQLVDTNLLESIADFRDLMKIYSAKEDVMTFLEVISSTFGVKAVFRLIDYAANTLLLVKFGLEPAARDIYEFATKWDRIMSRAIESSGTVYGKASHSFSVHGIPVTMVTRTSVRYSIPEESFMRSLLSLKQLGLEPTTSNLWDLVPFSFVVDWFTNMSGRFDYVDAGMHFVSVHVERYVHSYTMYIDFNDIPGFIGDGQLAIYRREVSVFFPYSHSSSSSFHDWLGDANVPPLIAGAMLWKFIRS